MARPKRKATADEMTKEAHLQLFYQVVELLNKYPYETWKQISKESGVSLPTLYSWVNWKIWCPHLRTVVNVAKALGYDIVLQKVNTSKKKLKSVK